MKRRLFMLFGATGLSFLAAFAQNSSDATHKGGTLQVHVSYSGAGAVDQSHKIYVALWDSPDFVKPSGGGSRPFAVASLSSKTGTVNFEDVEKNPVYVSMAYDPSGNWKGDTEPPIGTVLGLYSKEPGTPAPVQLESGKVTKITAKLDDSFKKDKMERQ
jgi:hypothetical protein